MSYHQDWLMRQIEAICTMLGYMLTGKKPQLTVAEESKPTNSRSNLLYQRLKTLVQQGEICTAENLLFAAMDEADPEVPEAAASFYADLNRLSDTELEAHDFSRDEVLEGLQAVCRHYGLEYIS